MLSFIFSFVILFQTNQVEVTKTNKLIEIDGIEDQVWAKAKTYHTFLQVQPIPKAIATESTEFKCLYDESSLYFFIKIYQDPKSIITKVSKHDYGTIDADWISISLDPLNKGRTGYQFAINPSNSQFDSKISNNGSDEDVSWNSVWESKTYQSIDGWMAEIKIPFKELKFQTSDVQTWGIQIIRHVQSINEKSSWPVINPDLGFRVSEMAKLQGIKGIKAQRNLDLLPSIVGTFDSDKSYKPKAERAVGLDLRYSINSQNTVLATFQPDFAQIEADHDEINLSDYPLYLQEKRPFFLKGNSIYSMPDNLYYSRRMTRPRAGAKLFGSNNSFSYGITAVNNDGLLDGNSNNENFFISRFKYSKKEFLEFGYFNGVVNSENGQSGAIHSIDFNIQLSSQFNFTGLSSKTYLKNENKRNHNILLKTEFNSEKWFISSLFKKKSKNYNQSLTGFSDTNNTTHFNIHIDRNIRFKNQALRLIEIHTKWNKNGLHNNELSGNSYEFNFQTNWYFKQFGTVYANIGTDNYNTFFRDYSKKNKIKHVYSDNFGTFTGEENTGKSVYGRIRTDYSNTYAGYVYFFSEPFKQATINGVNTELQIKQSNSMTLNFLLKYRNISQSLFIEAQKIKTLSFKMTYALQSNLFFKLYTQYNSQQKRLSNNIVMTYEYKKGNFFYFAYNEHGLIDSSADRNSRFVDYHLNQRVFSLKWDYAISL